MPRDEVGQYSALITESIAGKDRSSGRVRRFSGFTFDMGIGLESTNLPNISLKTRPELAQIMPLACKPSPISRAKPLSKIRRYPGDS